MPLGKRFTLLSSLCLVNMTLFSHETPASCSEECCGCTPYPQRIEVRHIEGKGVGYKEGYTTIEGFFTPSVLTTSSSWAPFIDLRAHVFNDGKPAVNAGLGFRYLTTRDWGVNAYYDYRNTHHGHFNQVGLGLESLGKIWDFRINGYLPVGKKRSHFFHTRFHEFSGNRMIISRKQEVAMKGGNAEVGAHIKKYENIALYAALGPYYFEEGAKNAWGGEGRFVLTSKNFRVQVSGSYDRIFHGIVQGELSLIVPFGERKEIRRRPCCECSQGTYTCKQERIVRERAVQKVDRFEIIVLDRKRRRSTAINPLTGQPFVFWFVDNTSHSNGTFESPFNTLIAAQSASSPNDVIYVFPGDGTSTGMSSGIILKNSQKLFGAGIEQKLKTTAGNVKIPALANSLPLISTVDGGITCANNNEISGIHTISPDPRSIVCININNTFIHDNLLTLSQGAAGASIGVYFEGSGGQLTIKDNVFNFNSSSSVFGVDLFSTAAGANYLITNNQFISPFGSQSTGIIIGDPASGGLGTINSLIITKNTFGGLGNNSNGGAIAGAGFAGSGYFKLDRNTFVQTNASGANTGIVQILFETGANIVADITNNTWERSQTFSADSLFAKRFAGVACIRLKNNQTDNPSASGYAFINVPPGGSMTVDIKENVGAVFADGGVIFNSCH